MRVRDGEEKKKKSRRKLNSNPLFYYVPVYVYGRVFLRARILCLSGLSNSLRSLLTAEGRLNTKYFIYRRHFKNPLRGKKKKEEKKKVCR